MVTKLKTKSFEELRIILKEEFGLELNKSDTEKIGMSLVGYFELLLRGEQREVRKPSI